MSEFKKTEKFVRNYGSQVENEIEARLKGHGKYASGKLYDSIRHEVREEAGKFVIKFAMAEYGFWVDKGSKPSKYADSTGRGKGKSKFIESLKKWCRIKGLPEGAAFPIRRKIWKFGIPPTNFFTIPTTRRKAALEKGIKENVILDVEQILRDDLKKRK
jgi:hypothetical protein